MKITRSAAEIGAMTDNRIRQFAGFAISAMDGTRFDPPMLIEAINKVTLPEFDTETIDITVWPANGWMVGISLTVDNGLTASTILELVRPV